MTEPLTKQDVEEVVDRKVGGLFDAQEKLLEAKLSTVAIQIGAVEKTTAEKIRVLGWKGVAALAGGQAVAGLLAALVARGGGDPSAPVRAAAELVKSLPLI